MMGSTAIEDLAKTVPDARLWMQITMLSDRARSQAICERAHAAGCRAIVLTVDCPVGAPRPRSEQFGPVALTGAPLPNVTLPGDPAGGELAAMVAGFDRAVTFDDIATVSEWAGGLPVVVKGVVRGDDALLCAQAGAAAVVVSNHGGRQLDQCVPTALALPEVVDAVGGQVEVLVDGGIRRGVHVLAALALGASGTLVGRLPVYGLAVGGEAGAHDVLMRLHDELATAMALCGVSSLAELSPDLLRLP
jgi:4-hydroxymandelate oxidase